MLRWSLLFLIIALIAAMFGFGIVYQTSMFAFKVVFFVFLALFVISLIAGNRTPRDAL